MAPLTEEVPVLAASLAASEEKHLVAVTVSFPPEAASVAASEEASVEVEAWESRARESSPARSPSACGSAQSDR